LPKRIKVVFLVLYFEAWDSLAEVYRLMLNDERFEPTVISIPRKLTGDETYHDEAKVSEFLSKANVEHLRFDFEDSAEGLNRLRELAPDYLFINYPWQRNYQPFYRVDRLVEFTRVCYVPYYSLPLVEEPGSEGIAPHLFTQRSHQLASFVFAQDAEMLEAYAGTDRSNAHVFHVGSPKLDALVEVARNSHNVWPLHQHEPAGLLAHQKARPRRLVWAPHHSYGPNWLNFGTFAKVYEAFLRFASRHPEIDVVLRPHPFLFGTLVDRQVISAEILNQWLERWNHLPNTHIDVEGNYAALFEATDLLISDGISFLGEYPLVTGRAGIFIENPGHWRFTHLGELAAEANLRVEVSEVAEPAALEALILALFETGLPDRSAQIEALSQEANPYGSKSAQMIVQTIANDYANGPSPLVNPMDVQTVAWERRPGTEPLVD
jgi:hypothetical protein